MQVAPLPTSSTEAPLLVQRDSSSALLLALHLTNPLHPQPRAQQQPQVRRLLADNLQVRLLITCSHAAQWPTSGPARLAPPCPSLRPRSRALQLVPGARGLPTPRVRLPFSITCSAHDQKTSAAAPAAPPRTPGPLPVRPPRGPPNPSGGNKGGVHPNTRPPNTHLFLLSPHGCSRRRPDPHPDRARLPQTLHSPRVGLLRHGADSQGLRCRLRPGPAAGGRTGDGLARAASGRRGRGPALAPSLARRAGREGGWRGGRAPRQPAPWARGGTGSALGGPPSPAATAAAPLRL